MELDIVFVWVDALQIEGGDDDVGKAQLLGFGDALLYTVDGTHFAAESHLATHAPSSLDGGVYVAGQYGGNHAEVHRHVSDSQSAGDIEKHVFLHELEAHPLLQYGEQHVESALVETRGRALGSAIGCRRNQCLGLQEEGAYALDGCTDGYA